MNRSRPRSIVLTLGLAALACTRPLAHGQAEVPGMRQFRQSGFWFTFWYPADWKIADVPVDDPTRGGWFRGGRIVKELKVENLLGSDVDQAPGVIVDEILAPHGLTELGRSRSASPVGADGTYFLDSKTHRWMYRLLSDRPDAPPSTNLLKIEQRTMGGLPVFYGAVRHGGEMIVPLDATRFLAVSTMDVGGFRSHLYLASTIESAHSRGSERSPDRARIDAIRREAVLLGAIGRMAGRWWYVDDRNVYDLAGEVIPGADPTKFTFLSQPQEGASFATDGRHVYWQGSEIVPDADPKTFVETGSEDGRDASHTYRWSDGRWSIAPLPAPTPK